MWAPTTAHCHDTPNLRARARRQPPALVAKRVPDTPQYTPYSWKSLPKSVLCLCSVLDGVKAHKWDDLVHDALCAALWALPKAQYLPLKAQRAPQTRRTAPHRTTTPQVSNVEPQMFVQRRSRPLHAPTAHTSVSPGRGYNMTPERTHVCALT